MKNKNVVMDKKLNAMRSRIAKAKAYVEVKPAGETIVKLDKHPSVSLVVTDNLGSVLMLASGENNVMHPLLRYYADRDVPASRLVTKVDNVLSPLGQDIYRVSWEFLMMARAGLVFLDWAEIKSLEKTLPSGTIFHIAVSW